MNINKHDIDFTISELQEGAVQEKVNKEVKNIVENILDLNTEFKIKRKLTIDITFASDESRQVITTTAQVKSKLAPAASISTTLLAGRNQDTGKVQAAELKSSAPGQVFFDPTDNQLKTDTGELIEKEEATNIIDYNMLNKKTN